MGISSEWQKAIFSKAVEVNPTRPLKRGAYVPFVSMPSVEPNRRKSVKIIRKKYSGGGAKFKNGDTLLARITPCLEHGKTVFMSDLEEGEVGFGSTEFIVLSGKEGMTSNLFVYYLCRYDKVRDFAIKSMTGSSGRQRVQAEAFNHLKIKIPPLPEQRKIAEILSSLDDKIELNYEMNKTLETIAQAIFRRWFIDFEPFQDKLIHNEELDKEIPKGWEITKLKKICKINMGQSPPSTTYNEEEEGLPFFQGIRDFGFRYPKPSVYCNAPAKIAEPDDILFSVRAPIGKLNITLKKSCIGRGITALRYKFGSNSFLFYLFKTLQNYWKWIYESGGTVFGCVTKEDLETFELAFPRKEIVERFNSIVKPLDEIIKTNELESLILTQIHDTLLPSLLSGEMRVKVGDEFPKEIKRLREIKEEKIKIQKNLLEWR